MTSNPNQRSINKYLYQGAFWVIAAALIIIPRVINLDVFFARDELTIWTWSDQFAQAVRQGDPAATLTQSDYPGIPLFWAQTMLAAPSSTSDHSDLAQLAQRRLAAGLLVSGQLLAAVWLVWRLFGPTTALISAILLGLDPFSLSEARVLRLEMISAGFVTLSLLAALLYYRGDGRSRLLLSGIMAGLGVSGKTSAGLLVPFVWLLLLLELAGVLRQNSGPLRRRLPTVVVNGLIWATGAIAAFWLIWPAMWVKPVAAINYVFARGLAQAADRSVWGDKVFFWGQIIDGGDPGPWFYPVALAFRVTPITWLGLAVVLGWLLWLKIGPKFSISASPAKTPPFFAAGSLLLLAFAVLMLLQLTPVVSKVDRFLIILLPALNILAALGLNILINGITTYATRNTPHSAWLPTGLTSLILIAQLSQTIPAHPYYFTYWNPLVGGGRAAMRVLPIGAGEGLDLAMDYLNRQPNAAALKVVCGGSEPWCEGVFKGQTMRFATYASGEWFAADYATTYISHLQRRRYPDELINFFAAQTPVYRVQLNGVDYAAVYRVPRVNHLAGAWNDLAGQGRLLGYSLGREERQAGDTVQATLWWATMGAGGGKLVVRLTDQTGYEWARGNVTAGPLLPEQRTVISGTGQIDLPPGMPPGIYFWKIGVAGPDKNRPLLGEFKLPAQADQLALVPGPIFTNPARFNMAYRLDDPLAPEITLLGYTPPAQVINAESPVWVSLFWQAAASPPAYEVRLRLVNEAGQEAARWQGPPGYGQFPTNRWQPGQIVQDVWPLQVPPQTPPGPYTLQISLHQPGQTEPVAGRPATIDGLQVWPRPLNFDLPAMQGQLQANFGDRLTLLGYDLFFDTNGRGSGALSPVFYWQSQANFEAAFNLRLTLRAADSGVVIETWQAPLGPGETKSIWQTGEVVSTIYQLEVGALAGGRYHLDIAVEDQANGQPLPVQAGVSARIENIQDKIVVRVTE